MKRGTSGTVTVTTCISTEIHRKAITRKVSWARALTLGINTIVGGFEHKDKAEEITELRKEIEETQRKLKRFMDLYYSSIVNKEE